MNFSSLPLVTITLAPKKITCALSSSYGPSKFIINKYEEFFFEEALITSLTIFLFARIKTTLQDFYKRNHIKNAYALFSLTPPGIHERVIGLHTETPQEHHLQQDDNPKQLVWDYIPLSTKNNQKTYYYACGITREQLFQYQLLALMANINCLAIVPQRFALFNASTFMHNNEQATTAITNHALLQSYLNYTMHSVALDHLITSNQPIEKNVLMEITGLLLLARQLHEYA